jgi:hypothetical protein
MRVHIYTPCMCGCVFLQSCELDAAESTDSGTRSNGGFIRIVKTLRIFKVISHLSPFGALKTRGLKLTKAWVCGNVKY